jgi:hypothetical protein
VFAFKKLTCTLVVAAASMVMSATTISPAAAATAAETYGCPSGAVCLYSGDTTEMIRQGPVAIWWDGVNNLSNVYGHRAIYNHQYGGWTVQLCHGYNGTDCRLGNWVDEGLFGFADFGPINSVWLHAGSPRVVP